MPPHYFNAIEMPLLGIPIVTKSVSIVSTKKNLCPNSNQLATYGLSGVAVPFLFPSPLAWQTPLRRPGELLLLTAD